MTSDPRNHAFALQRTCGKICESWHKLSKEDGGLGICDNIKSDHHNHLIGHNHLVCVALLELKYETCPTCKGSGLKQDKAAGDYGVDLDDPCDDCWGAGKVEKSNVRQIV